MDWKKLTFLVIVLTKDFRNTHGPIIEKAKCVTIVKQEAGGSSQWGRCPEQIETVCFALCWSHLFRIQFELCSTNLFKTKTKEQYLKSSRCLEQTETVCFVHVDIALVLILWIKMTFTLIFNHHSLYLPIAGGVLSPVIFTITSNYHPPGPFRAMCGLPNWVELSHTA